MAGGHDNQKGYGLSMICDIRHGIPLAVNTETISIGESFNLQIISPDNDVIVVSPIHTSGTEADSNWSANVIFPAGFSRGFVQATWMP